MLQDINFISHCSSSLSTSAPPFTVDNVLAAVQGVDWWTLGEALLCELYDVYSNPVGAESKLREIQGQHQSDANRLHAVVKTWIQGSGIDKETSWRHLLYTLDRGSMTGVADNIRHFAEPVLGKSCDSISHPHSCTVWEHNLFLIVRCP